MTNQPKPGILIVPMSTWFARRALDLAGTVSDVYYTLKYGTMARRLGRPDITPDRRRGFIIIQIDGLSYDHLRQALAAGHMPYLARLLESGRLNVAPWRCGLPTTTPAVQAGIMFGNRFDIPGFRWYEKERGRGMSVKRPDQVQEIRARISQGRTGILRGGSCYVSMFDGDADVALFTLSTLSRRRFFESARGVGLFMLFLLSPIRVLRLLGLSISSYLTESWRRLIGFVRPSVVNPLDVLSPILHAISDAVFTEVQTFGVMLDIYRCAPAIYANYNNYDEVAHRFGANHRAALRTLRGIDRRIHQIDRMRARYVHREYDLYLLSDHGNSPATPFLWINRVSLGQHIATQIGEGLSVGEPKTVEAYSAEKLRYLLQELETLEDHSSRRMRRVLAAARRHVDRRVPSDDELNYNWERQQDIVVSASGSLAHVYFNVSPRPLELAEVLLVYPQLVETLLGTPGIGAIAGRAEEQTIMLGKHGGSLVTGGEHESLEPPHPLALFGDVAYSTAQLHRLAHFPHAGDLIILGTVQQNGKVVGFEEQAAVHGGLGGPQERPFIAWPSESALMPEKVNDAQDLYAHFAQYHLQQPHSE